MVYKAYKTELDCNNRQRTLFMQHLGCARWAYNWALSKKKEAFANKQKTPSAFDLHKELNKLKLTELQWMYESSKTAPQNALADCDSAFVNFFRRCKQNVKGKKGFPKYKSKKNDKQSFRLCGAISVGVDYIKLPRIGKVKIFEKNYIPTRGKILSATISKKAGKWFVSVQMEVDVPEIYKLNDNVIGVDLGIKTLATCSDGVVFIFPTSLKRNIDKIKKKQKQLSRKKKNSNNYNKKRMQLSKLHYRIASIRKDTLHKTTSKIINDNQVIVLEDLKISNMVKNHKLSRSILSVGFYEFRRQIEHKAKWRGRTVVFANPFYPSSKLCSLCGWKNEKLSLSDRIFRCQCCELEIDRDLNASLNLANIYTASSAEIEACGERNSENENSLSCSMKQEFNREIQSLISLNERIKI